MNRRREWIIATAGGFVFLFAAGVGWLTAGTLSFILPLDAAALVYLLHVVAALPLALGMRKLLGLPPVSRGNPLRPLVVQIAIGPLVASPAIVLAWHLEPAYMPLAYAAVLGAQLIPFSWLMQTRIYILLGLAVALGPALLAWFMGKGAFHFTGLYVGLALIAGALAANARADRQATRAHD